MHEFYQVLGVRSEAADEEIKAAFRRSGSSCIPTSTLGMRQRSGGFKMSYAPTGH